MGKDLRRGPVLRSLREGTVTVHSGGSPGVGLLRDSVLLHPEGPSQRLLWQPPSPTLFAQHRLRTSWDSPPSPGLSQSIWMSGLAVCLLHKKMQGSGDRVHVW